MSFFLETTWKITIIFHMKPIWDRRMKLYGQGQMPKMAATPICSKILKSNPSTTGPITLKTR